MLRPRPRQEHRHPAAVHDRGLLPLRGRRRTPRSLSAAHVRRPRLDYESHATGRDRTRRAAGRRRARPARRACADLLLALNRLRVSEATGADIETLMIERGHRILAVTRK